MKFEDFLVEDWIRSLDEYFGRAGPKPRGRPPKKTINDELIIQLKKEGYSNRRIAREYLYSRRTIDYRVNKLRLEGRL